MFIDKQPNKWESEKFLQNFIQITELITFQINDDDHLKAIESFKTLDALLIDYKKLYNVIIFKDCVIQHITTIDHLNFELKKGGL